MKRPKIHGFLAVLGIFALTACDDAGTELLGDDLTTAEQAELSVLTDPGSFEVAMELADATTDAAFVLGHDRAIAGRTFNAQARAEFLEARAAMMAGEDREALAAARRARRLVARALSEIGGNAALEALIERIEALIVTADDDVFDNAEALKAELEVIVAQAKELLAQGDTLAAAALALLGEQRARFRRGRRHHPDIDVDRARLAVSLAATAVALAERLIADDAVPVISAVDTHVTDRQNRWLAQAKRLLSKAETALENGNLRRAVHFAQHANWSALKAVILPGGIHPEEVRALVELAQDLHEQAKAALGDDPTELELRLFNRAGDLITIGIERLEHGHLRGVAAIWRAAVISSWLLG